LIQYVIVNTLHKGDIIIIIIIIIIVIRDSTVSILNDLWFEFRHGRRISFSPHRSYRLWGAHPVSYLVGTGVLSRGVGEWVGWGVKMLGCEVDHSRSSRAEVKNE
jgi:hypothetical protein